MGMLGAFEVQAIAGKGAMGMVWRGVHPETELPVAIKTLSPEYAWNTTFLVAFRVEVRAIAALNHPQIVRIFDHGVVPEGLTTSGGQDLPAGCPYLVLEWCGTPTLQDRLPLKHWEQARDILDRLLEALSHAHARGVLHRDLKPANLLVGGDPPQWKLTDFGIARQRDTSMSGRGPMSAAGTPAFMAPEQISGRWRDQGPWTDLYAVGCLAWRILTGEPPFGGTADRVLAAHLTTPPGAFKPKFDVPDGIEPWLRTLLSKDHHLRPAFAAEARRALRLLGGSTLRVPAESWFEPQPTAGTLLPDTGLGLVGLRQVQMVDRQDEREQLWQALGAVYKDDRSRVFLLVGPSGCGKSRLARWLCEEAHTRGLATWLRVSHGDLPSPDHGLPSALAGELGCRGLDAGQAFLRIDELTGDAVDSDDCARLAAMFCGKQSQLSARERNALLIPIIAWLARTRPLILWLDDVHWGLESLHLVRQLLASQHDTPVPVLVVMTAGEEGLTEDGIIRGVLEDLVEEHGARRIGVGPLPTVHRRELVRRILGLEPGLAAQVEERSAGNPRFAVELVRSWGQGGFLEAGPQGYRLAPGAPSDLPQDLGRVWRERFERLLGGQPRGAAPSLELAAVLGMYVDAGDWTEACKHADLSPAWDVVDRLLEARLAVSRARVGVAGNHWEFAHSMLREALLQRAADGGRLKPLHRACARMLRARGDQGEQTAERLGQHLLASGRRKASLDPLVEGARQRLMRGDLPGTVSVLRTRTRAMDELGLSATDPLRGAGVHLELAALRRMGQLDEAEELARSTWDVVRRHGWQRLAGPLLFERAELARARSDLEGAVALLKDALAWAIARDNDAERVCALRHLSMCMIELGDYPEARRLAQGALDGAIDLADPFDGCWALRLLGHTKLAQGELDEAAEDLTRARRMARRHGYALLEGTLFDDLGNLSWARGDLNSAARAFRSAARLARRSGDRSAGLFEMNLAGVLILAGHAADARAVLARWKHAPAARDPELHAAISLTRALLAATTGRWPELDEALGEALTRLEKVGPHARSQARLLQLCIDACNRAGQVWRAKAMLAVLPHTRATS